MLLSLRSDHKDHLSFLTPQPPEVVVDFCKLAIDFLQNGPNSKLYATAAEKMLVDANTVQNCIYGLIRLLLLSCKHNLSEVDFRDSVLTIGFSPEQQYVLNKFYNSKKNEIRGLISRCPVNEPHYSNLEWRFEIQVATRSLLHQVTPIITIDLQLKTGKGENASKKNIILQTDVTNLIHIAKQLEEALKESRSRHSRKIQRALNNC